jgi:hypothetical protein
LFNAYVKMRNINNASAYPCIKNTAAMKTFRTNWSVQIVWCGVIRNSVVGIHHTVCTNAIHAGCMDEIVDVMLNFPFTLLLQSSGFWYSSNNVWWKVVCPVPLATIIIFSCKERSKMNQQWRKISTILFILMQAMLVVRMK